MHGGGEKVFNIFRCINPDCNQKLRYEFRESKGRITCTNCKKQYTVVKGGVIIGDSTNEKKSIRYKKPFFAALLALFLLLGTSCWFFFSNAQEEKVYDDLNKIALNNLKTENYNSFYQLFTEESRENIEFILTANLKYNRTEEIKEFKELLNSIELIDYTPTARLSYVDKNGNKQYIQVNYIAQKDGSFLLSIDEDQLF